LEFCKTCGDVKIKKNNYKCFKCEGDFTSENKPNNTPDLNTSSSFPFKKGKYYGGKLIRDLCNAHPRWGISYNTVDNSWTVIKTKKSKSNIYEDKMVKDGLYSYVGQGLASDQEWNSSNLGLKIAESKKQKIHLFWQSAMGSDFKYLGEVKVVDIKDATQPDQNGLPRNVFVFYLQIVE